jgi:hypothetical protein
VHPIGVVTADRSDSNRRNKDGHSDLILYWIFENGSARVERRIPLLPYSKEVGKLKRLKQGLALYRMVFGQPRQEDLLFSFSQNGNHESVDLTEWLISLQPPETDLNDEPEAMSSRGEISFSRRGHE